MTQDLVVNAKALHKEFIEPTHKHKIEALKNINFSVNRGELTALVGPDGAGKTTLLRMIAGLMQATKGELCVLGFNMRSTPQSVHSLISYMPQRFGLYEDLSVQENLNLYADLQGVSPELRQERFKQLLEMTSLNEFSHRAAGNLSGGMKQKLGLACTLVRSPQLLLLDEPTVGVDPLSRQELWKIILQLVKNEQLTVIISTSYLDEAQRCNNVYLLNDGDIITRGSPQSLNVLAQDRCYLFTPKSGQKARIFQSQLLDNKTQVVDAVPQGGKVRCVLHKDASIEDIKRNLEYEACEPVEARLEDAFMVELNEHMKPDEVVVDKLKKTKPHPLYVDKPIVSVKNLVRKFDNFVAVSKTSFDVYPGDIFGLLGPNGAGKTTTFRMLCGLLPATSGELSVAGKNLRTATASARARIGYVSQKFSLYGNLSVYENLRFYAGAYGLWGKNRNAAIERVCDQFDLHEHIHAPSGLLPGGYKQRLAMAASLMHEPEILFLDEPTSGADPLARRAFWRRITALAEQGTAIIITTHFMEEAEYCDRILIQDAGRKLAMGSPQEIRQQTIGSADSITMEQSFIQIIENNRRASTKGTVNVEP